MTRKYPHRHSGPTSLKEGVKVPAPQYFRGERWIELNPKEVEKALYANHASLVKAAEELRVPRRSLKKVIDRNPEFKEIYDDAKEAFKDMAEWAIRERVLEGHPTMQIFYAKAQMGWVEEERKRGQSAPVQINLNWNDGSKPEVEVPHEPVQEIESGE